MLRFEEAWWRFQRFETGVKIRSPGTYACHSCMTVNHLYDAVYHTLSQCVCYWTIRVSQFYDSESPVSCVWQLRENCTKCMIHICDTVTVFDTYIWKCLLLTMELWARLFHRQFLLGRIGWILRIMMMMTICRGGSNHGFYGRWTEERYDEIFRY